MTSEAIINVVLRLGEYYVLLGKKRSLISFSISEKVAISSEFSPKNLLFGDSLIKSQKELLLYLCD